MTISCFERIDRLQGENRPRREDVCPFLVSGCTDKTFGSDQNQGVCAVMLRLVSNRQNGESLATPTAGDRHLTKPALAITS